MFYTTFDQEQVFPKGNLFENLIINSFRKKVFLYFLPPKKLELF